MSAPQVQGEASLDRKLALRNPVYTVIAPIYNEQDNLPELYRRGGGLIQHQRKLGIDPGR